jgi:hypothetical protein
MQTFKQFLENADPLVSLQVEMFFRHELEMSKVAATEAAAWIADEKDWADLEHDVRDVVLDYIDKNIDPGIYGVNSRQIEWHAMEKMQALMHEKYGIKL